MKWRRVAILVVAFSLMGGSLLFADAASQKVKILLNGSELQDGGYIIDGKTYVPVRELEGFAEYNDSTKTVNYYKPNVHITLLTSKEKVFTELEKTGKLTFNVFAQIDNLKKDINAMKVTITDPSGDSKVIQNDEFDARQGNFSYRTKDYTYDFKSAGSYTISVYMRAASGSDYVLVSQKKIDLVK
ncbi:copper amine oxidase [Paenibacillus sp. DYY-L-2]|uniref:copper amine oxidase n=1 Tax=Paenibacillus sp. DYY-L-2 TaxID=3447013 RepID=UPI003F4F7E32